MAGGTLTSQKDTKMHDLNSSTQPSWERLPNETPRAYHAFCIFRDLGPDRSQDKAYARDCDERGRKPAKAPGSWSKWSIKYKWVERAEAYDDWLDEEKRNQEAAAREEHQLELSKFARKIFHERIDRREELCSLLKKASNVPLSKLTQTKKDAAGAKIVTQLGPNNPGQVADLNDSIGRLERQIIEDLNPKELEDERKIERIVWVKNPKKDDPPKDSDPDVPDHSGPGKVRPISPSDIDDELSIVEGDEEDLEDAA